MIDTAVILAGGKGTRLAEFTRHTPKPMLAVAGVPILVHIMRHYKKHGVTKFIIPVGYLCEHVYTFFGNFGKVIEVGENHSRFEFEECEVIVVYTGEETETAGRLLRVVEFLPQHFYYTYGDGLSDVDVTKVGYLLENAPSEILGVMTAVPQPHRFGVVDVDDMGFVKSFNEKPAKHFMINGGFFALDSKVLSKCEDGMSFEKDVLPELCKEFRLLAYTHDGFWMCIDTIHDLDSANERYANGFKE